MADATEDAIEDAKAEAFIPKDRDWLLADLVRLFPNNGVEIGITLNVEGALISGMLISGKNYCEEMSSKFKEISENDSDIFQALGVVFSNYIHMYDQPNQDENGIPILISYIHLRDAKFFTPSGSLPSGEGTHWRVRLDKVNGFSIGKLSHD